MLPTLQSAAERTFAPGPVLFALEEVAQGSSGAAEELDALPQGFLVTLGEVLVISPPMRDSLRRHPDWIGWLARRVPRAPGSDPADLAADWRRFLTDRQPGVAPIDLLRAFKRRAYLEILYRDVAGSACFQETVDRLSALADFVIREALGQCWLGLQADLPATLAGYEGAPHGFSVFALGKLGGAELNYSSDVDLLFCRRVSDSDQELRFLTRLGERLTQALSGTGPDGFLYRVDMRLRPHGETGPLVPTIASMLNYYESWGEAWERQALIKTRFVAGCDEIGRRFLRFVETFTFSRQMDDSSLEEIKRVKHRAEREYAIPGRVQLKQGPGGIRDIEFYVQFLQLVAGPAHPEARSGTTLIAISALAGAKALLSGEESLLSLAYVFLRTVEHRLQLRSLTPQSILPVDQGELRLLALGLGFPSEGGLEAVLQRYRAEVRRILERVYLSPGYLRLNEGEEEFARLLSERAPRERVREILSQYGFEDIDRAWQNLRLLALGPAGRLLPPGERRAFLECVFPLLEVLKDSLDPDQALHNLESFASATGNRVSFLRALASRRPHLMRLSNLLAISNRCHQILIRHPEYFDSLARGVFLHEGRGAEGMLAEIRERIAAAPGGDAPDLVLRRYRQREMVRIAYRDLAGLGDELQISRELSELAEACVCAAAALTATPMRGSAPQNDTFEVIALGKLGSRQMHYGSDLDLLFLYEPPPGARSPEQRASAQREQDGRAERIAELLSGVTAEGMTYAVDLRLRAEGASGLLARTWESFLDHACAYMQPWERMALIRSRALGGCARWPDAVARIVYEFAWDAGALEAVRHIKRRIETEKSKESRTHLDFKYGKGGVADLEFLVQLLQVQYGGRHPEVRHPGIAQALPALQSAGALTGPETDRLLKAHRFLRRVENRYQLLEEWHSREISRESPKLSRLASSLGYRADARAAARRAFLSDWDENARIVRELFERYFSG